MVSPLYISEVAVAQYRGRLVSLYQLALIVILFLVLDGRIKARTGLILAVIPVAGIVFLDYMINYFNFNI